MMKEDKTHPIDLVRKGIVFAMPSPVIVPGVVIGLIGDGLSRVGDTVFSVGVFMHKAVCDTMSSIGIGKYGAGFLTYYQLLEMPAIVTLAHWEKSDGIGTGVSLAASWGNGEYDMSDEHFTLDWSDGWVTKPIDKPKYRMRRMVYQRGPFVRFKTWREYQTAQPCED